ncbi:hypothetical protein BDZ97DRAFT_1758708 [Flammula alnicola]|nr:hypothetical protein BDZ97DRAFT_1758708 [Flammula alnicola]
MPVYFVEGQVVRYRRRGWEKLSSSREGPQQRSTGPTITTTIATMTTTTIVIPWPHAAFCIPKSTLDPQRLLLLHQQVELYLSAYLFTLTFGTVADFFNAALFLVSLPHGRPLELAAKRTERLAETTYTGAGAVRDAVLGGAGKQEYWWIRGRSVVDPVYSGRVVASGSNDKRRLIHVTLDDNCDVERIELTRPGQRQDETPRDAGSCLAFPGVRRLVDAG